MNLFKHIVEFRRRKVFRALITYLVIAWLIAQVSSIVLPIYNVPDNFMKIIISILIIGCPICLVLTWLYDKSPSRIKKNEFVDTYKLNIKKHKHESIKKLLVLPFENRSPDKESNYFSDGLTEEIIMRLSGVKELDIISKRTSMKLRNHKMDLKSLGYELNIKYILQGSVLIHNGDLKISTELIDIENDLELWAEIFNGKFDDIFKFQDKVSKKIVKSLKLNLSNKEKASISKKTTKNTNAYDANLRAREFMHRYTKKYLLLAIELFQNAIDLDPKYSTAYAGMAEACALLYETHDKNFKWIKKAEKASLKALILDPNSSEAFSALAMVYFNKNLYNEALIAAENAISFDTKNYFAHWVRGRIYRVMGRDKESIFDFNKVLELNADFHSPYGDLQMVYETLNDKKNLQNTLNRAALFYSSYLLRHPEDSRAHQFYAFTLKRLGRIDEAKQEMKKGIEQNPNDPIIIYNTACFYALLGDKKSAIYNLNKAIVNGFENFEYLKHDPDFNNLKKDPEFIQIVEGKSKFEMN